MVHGPVIVAHNGGDGPAKGVAVVRRRLQRQLFERQDVGQPLWLVEGLAMMFEGGWGIPTGIGVILSAALLFAWLFTPEDGWAENGNGNGAGG